MDKIRYNNFVILGDTFYIISEGEVTVTKRNNEKDEEIRKLTKGEYFGEQVPFLSFYKRERMDVCMQVCFLKDIDYPCTNFL